MILAFLKIFKNLTSILTTVILTVLLMLLMIAIPQLKVILGTAKLFSLTEVRFWDSTFTIIGTSFSVMSLFQTLVLVLISLALAVNIVLFVVYARNYKKRLSLAGTKLSFLGMVAALFGVGCLSCGVLILAPLASILGIGFATWLAQHGVWVSVVGFFIVCFSIYLLLKKITNPALCRINE